MIHSVHTQLARLQGGAAPDHQLIAVLENVKDEAKYLGCIVKEDGEKWPNASLRDAFFWADRAIVEARQFIRCETIRTTATPNTMVKLRSAVQYAVEKVEGCLA